MLGNSNNRFTKNIFFGFLKSGKTIILLLLILVNYISATFSQTLYSYQSGAWDNVDTWTTDPGGTTLVGSRVPGNNDVVVILPSRTVTLRNGNVTNTGLDITIQSGGILDDSISTFTQTLLALRGQGTLKLKTTSFPVATTNTFVNTGGGTVEYYNTSNYNLPSTQLVYNNLTFNIPGYIATQNVSKITLNGDLNIQNGTYRINDNTATRDTLIVYGNVIVSAGAYFRVGTGNTTSGTLTGGTAPFLNYYTQQSHTIMVYGDFTNNGNVRFTNQSYPQFGTIPTNGIASVFFMGASNNVLTCNDTTTFYNLVIDKGTDQTYELNVNSAGYDKFRLFGANNYDIDGALTSNPNLRKALWIRTGTLKLNGYVFIPTLTEGGSDFFIPENGAMLIDGPEVVVIGTIDDYRVVNLAYNVNGGTGTANSVTNPTSTNPQNISCGFSLYGKFQINDGKFYVGEIGRVIYLASPTSEFIVNGGILDFKQFQSSGTGGGKTAYWQTEGDIYLRGRFQRTIDYSTRATLISSIGLGTLNTARVTYGMGTTPLGTEPQVGTFNIDQDANVFHMEGGTIKIYDPSGSSGTPRALEINSDPTNVSVTNGTIEIYMTDGTVLADANYGIATKANLYNLSITRSSETQSATMLTIPAKAGVTAVASPPLKILNNLTLSDATGSANAVLNSGNFDLYVGGNFNIQTNAEYTPGTNRTILNGTGSQTFTNSGTILGGGLYRFYVDKNSGTATLGSNITVRDSLGIISGTINDGGYSLYIAGHVYTAGTHTGNGKIVLNGTANQNLSASLSGNPSLGNIEVTNTTGANGTIVATLASDLTINGLTLTSNRILNIGSYKLSVGSGGLATGLTYSVTRMIQTNGLNSDGGLKLTVNAASLTTGNTLLFPIGVSGKYTPATINGNTTPGTGTGYVTFVPVNTIHPAQNASGRHLLYYWKSKATGMPSGSNVYYTLYNNIAGDWESGVNRAYTLLLGSTTWNSGGSAGRPDINLNGLANSNGFISADITAGNNGAFNNITAYYSIGSGAWNTNIWSNTSHTGATCNCQPNSTSDIVYIGGQSTTPLIGTRTAANDSIWLPAGTYNLATITINGTYTNNERRPTLNLQGNGGSLTVDIIKGAGKLSSSSATLYAGTTDMGELLNNDSAVIQYYGAMTNLPNIYSYPNLLITGNNTKNLPASTVVVKQSLMIADGTNANNALSLNGISGDLTVNGDVKFLNGGKLIVPVSGTARNINIYGDINFKYLNTNAANAIVAYSGAGTTHKLNFYGDSIISGASKFSFNRTNNNKIDLYIKDAGRTVITDGTATDSLNRLYIQKDVLTDTVYYKKNFLLNETGNNSTPKSLNLSVGTLVLSDAANGSTSSINLNLSSGGTTYFSLNNTSALIIKNGAKINITGNTSGSGLRLDGRIQAEGISEINLADGTAGNTGYVEYSGSGNAVINLSGSSVFKADQVRRSTSLTTGILKYYQSGSSTATIYGLNANATRAKFEVTTAGSVFNMSSNSSLSILRSGGTTYGDLYLRPETGSITDGTIILGTGLTGQTFKIDAETTINNLTIANNNSAQLMVNPLSLNGDLLINTGSTLNAVNASGTSINLSLKGDFTNNGTYTYGTNTTTFNGAAQSLAGSTSTNFYNLTISSTDTVTLSHIITVNNDLLLSSGTLESGSFDINLKGDLTNNSSYTNDPSPATSALILNGTSEQIISGSGNYARIELDNNAGVRLASNISLSEDITFTNGVLNINQYLLTLGVNSDIQGTGFGTSKMIKPDGVFSNIGIKKFFNSGDSGTFVYPLGVTGKYTPAVLNIDSTDAGFVRVNVINDKHPATYLPYNVLQYYWEGESAITGFVGSLKFKYSNSDVVGDETQYVAARLLVPGINWSKAAAGSTTDNVDETNDTIAFDFSSKTNNLSGHYTAGYDSDIPDIIPTYTSDTIDGNWSDPDSWTPTAPVGGPNGFVVNILPGHTIHTAGNRKFAYQTTVDGTLDIGTTVGHNLGSVYGTGTLALKTAILPAGRMTSFLSCSGGTLEYGGTTNYTIVADRIDTLYNLHFTGTGTRTLPNKDLYICNELLINGPTLDNSVNNRKLTIAGSFTRTAGIFNCGTGNNATVSFKGTSAQTITGFNLTSSSKLNNLEINNSAGLTLNSDIDINGDLLLTSGTINTHDTSILNMVNQASTTYVVPDGGSATSFVNGPMSKYLFSGNDFIFPVGKSSRYGKIQLLNVQNDTWEAEYYNAPYSDLTVTGTLSQASSTEYWRIKSPSNGKTAVVELRWDSQSDITPVTTSGGINDIRVAEFNGTDWAEKSSDTPIGDDNDGTVSTSANIAINNGSHPQYYTLGSISTVKPTITLGTNPVMCTGTTSVSLPYTSTTGSPNQYRIDFDATANTAGFRDTTWTTLPSSPITIAVPPSALTGTYNANIQVRISSPVNASINYPFTVTVISPPSISVHPASISRCVGTSATFSVTASGTGLSYQWRKGGSNITGATSSSYTISNVALTDAGTFDVVISSGNCSATSNSATLTVNSLPTITLGSNPSVCRGIASIDLTYSATTNSPDQYSIDFNAAAESAGFLDVTNLALPASPVSITVPVNAPVALYNATLTVYNSTSTCTSSPSYNITITVNYTPATGPMYRKPNN